MTATQYNISNVARVAATPVLSTPPNTVSFDPDNKAHRMAFAQFLDTGRLSANIRFQVEWPHTSAVTTIQTKLTQYALRKELARIEADKVAADESAELVA